MRGNEQGKARAAFHWLLVGDEREKIMNKAIEAIKKARKDLQGCIKSIRDSKQDATTRAEMLAYWNRVDLRLKDGLLAYEHGDPEKGEELVSSALNGFLR